MRAMPDLSDALREWNGFVPGPMDAGSSVMYAAAPAAAMTYNAATLTTAGTGRA
jgi:hypothetical protein